MPRQKKEILQSPKGMHDMLHGDIQCLEKILEKAHAISEFYGFQRIATPHLEHTEIFERPLGETSDVVEKQMYTLRTRGGDSLTLRPEETAPIMRAYEEHGMSSWPQPVKLSYEGSFFRHENPQRGRFREFRQFGIEALGEEDAVIDATVIKVLYLILKELGFENVIIRMNSIGDRECRPVYKKELSAYYRKKANYLCKDCKRRLKENPLRMLDCKEPGCIEIRLRAPQMIRYLCDPCKAHFKFVLEFLEEAGIPYLIDNYLVRGFDYYGRTVFEIFLEAEEEIKTSTKNLTSDVLQEAPAIAVGGGGRYDELMTLLGGRPLPAVGGALGAERVVFEMKKRGLVPKPTQIAKVFLIQIGSAAKKRSFTLMEDLRHAGVAVDESLARDSLKAQLNIAVKVGARIAIILGQKETMENSVILRDMDEGTQETIPQHKLCEKIKSVLKTKK